MTTNFHYPTESAAAARPMTGDFDGDEFHVEIYGDGPFTVSIQMDGDHNTLPSHPLEGGDYDTEEAAEQAAKSIANALGTTWCWQ